MSEHLPNGFENKISDEAFYETSLKEVIRGLKEWGTLLYLQGNNAQIKEAKDLLTCFQNDSFGEKELAKALEHFPKEIYARKDYTSSFPTEEYEETFKLILGDPKAKEAWETVFRIIEIFKQNKIQSTLEKQFISFHTEDAHILEKFIQAFPNPEYVYMIFAKQLLRMQYDYTEKYRQSGDMEGIKDLAEAIEGFEKMRMPGYLYPLLEYLYPRTFTHWRVLSEHIQHRNRSPYRG